MNMIFELPLRNEQYFSVESGDAFKFVGLEISWYMIENVKTREEFINDPSDFHTNFRSINDIIERV